jgi:hypothetical protein
MTGSTDGANLLPMRSYARFQLGSRPCSEGPPSLQVRNAIGAVRVLRLTMNSERAKADS